MSRRENTERAILQAVGEQICETGMSGVGINSVAKRAGVSRELIYRYFGGMPELMLAWMKEQDFWTQKTELLKKDETSQKTPSELILAMLHDQMDALTNNAALCEVRRWELIERNEVSAQLATRREGAARSFINRVDGLTKEADIPAVVSVMLAGILYLNLRAKTEECFLGIPLREKAGQQRITDALNFLVKALPKELTTQSLEALEEARTSLDNTE
ncbi:TetR/AcrR family transcriptional regulator [Pseudochrobactrum asaccharolyticum]|jgi:AcrR family transcriptional regulator|uniref:TetR family transcriptional regulator n=1 Tax=Pseudochrobactrum asaccharolyticum TaxID=354351 RepID=A0A366DM80_9HYPH|nr:TetR/AcrR family transcriptional regulator [Pseudochrobactrum asaccharolyticum]MDR2310638.1 TetR/AcrR family transcriptional regulator [Brucellaceae bacterium]RBO91156.1 TetR family transcriptional regulator [Pseudochrobactrum asaccharolyticum]